MTLIDKAEALAPCPFCTEGKSVSTYFDHEQGDKWGYASCDACGARGPEVRTSYDRDDNAPWRAEAIAAWNRRAAIPARGVGVKPLVWRQYCSNAGNSSAPAFGGEYICERAGEYGHYGVWFPCDGPNSEPRIYHAELPVAKAAAQADYEARILAALATTDAATQKGGDAHDRRLRSHEASPGVTAGADAAQAREAALMEAHKAILAMDTKKDEDLTYNLAVLRAAKKVRRLISEART